jgi:hypothetical protein
MWLRKGEQHQSEPNQLRNAEMLNGCIRHLERERENEHVVGVFKFPIGNVTCPGDDLL